MDSDHCQNGNFEAAERIGFVVGMVIVLIKFANVDGGYLSTTRSLCVGSLK